MRMHWFCAIYCSGARVVMPSDPMPDEVTVPDPRVMHRLHPFSWLFVLLTQLRPLVVPLLLLLFVGSGERWELFIAVGAIAYAGYSLVYSIGFRYQLTADELVVKEGIFSRTERHIPYARIQNIVRRRNLLHRAFGVAQLRLESAGGTTPEAVMNVITLAAAEQIEAVLRAERARPATSDALAPALLALDWRELLRLGLVRNRGGVLVGALFALAWQFDLWEGTGVRDDFRAVGKMFVDGAEWLSGPLAIFSTIAALALAFYVAMKLLSITMAYLNFHNFRLVTDGIRVATEGGLLTRDAASARVDKIQRLIYGESWFSRKLGRRWLACDVAAGKQSGDEERQVRLRWLAPIARPAQIESLVGALAPGLELKHCNWQALHPHAWRRVFKTSALIWSLVMIPVSLVLGYYVALVWIALMFWSYVEARGWARFSGYSYEAGVFAYRSGFLTHEWVIARITKGQGVCLSISPFDRRAGMAKVELDTAGSSAIGSRMQVPYLSEAQARALRDHLRKAIDGEMTPPAAG